MYEISQGRSMLPSLGFTINPAAFAFGIFCLSYVYLLFFMYAPLYSRGFQKDTMFLRGLSGLWWQMVGAIDQSVFVFKLPQTNNRTAYSSKSLESILWQLWVSRAFATTGCPYRELQRREENAPHLPFLFLQHNSVLYVCFARANSVMGTYALTTSDTA